MGPPAPGASPQPHRADPRGRASKKGRAAVHAVGPEDNLDFRPLPKPRRGRSEREYDRIFAEGIKARTGEWAVYDVHTKRQLAQNDRSRILAGKRAWDGGNFEVATRKTTETPPRWQVYVRYVGP